MLILHVLLCINHSGPYLSSERVELDGVAISDEQLFIIIIMSNMPQ